MVDVDDILKKYGSKIEGQMGGASPKGDYSNAYLKFKEELSPELSGYEKACKKFGSFAKMKLNKKDEKKLLNRLKTRILMLRLQALQGLRYFHLLQSCLSQLFLL